MAEHLKRQPKDKRTKHGAQTRDMPTETLAPFNLSQTNLLDLQRVIGNRRLQTLLTQRESAGDHTPQSDEEAEATGATAPPGLQPLGTQPIPQPSTDTVKDAIRENRMRSGAGMPLQDQERGALAPVLGHDLSAARVHVDPGADALTDALGARAATIGNDIYVASDQYKPGTDDYRQLLAHEATHIAQSGGLEGEGQLIGDVDSAQERQAGKAENAVSLGKMVSVRPRAAATPYVQRAPRPLPPDAVAMTFPTPLDSGPVLTYCEQAVGEWPLGFFGGYEALWPHMSALEGDITQIFGSGYFSQRNTSWSGEQTYDAGFLQPYYTVTVTIRLLEDNVREVGAGGAATVGSTSGVTATGGSSRESTRTTTATGSATVGGQRGPETGRVSGSAEAGGSVEAGTTLGRTTGVSMGGAATGSVGSGTALYESDVFAEVRVRIRQWDSLATYHSHSETRVIRVGTARYSRPTLAAPPASPTPSATP